MNGYKCYVCNACNVM
uniref:Uncharacterized protein n=1 Tax=Anguilla anguilla TaxID=7936 RepID=A0A0E9V203_ANGAN